MKKSKLFHGVQLNLPFPVLGARFTRAVYQHMPMSPRQRDFSIISTRRAFYGVYF